jgi:hypothetical protein
MAKKGNSPKASGRKGKTSPKMQNPRFSKSKAKRGRGPVALYLSEMDSIEKAQQAYVLVDEIDLRIPEPSHLTVKGRRYWGRPTQSKRRHLPLRTCEKHMVRHYTGCTICMQERFEGKNDIPDTQLWAIGKVQISHARNVAEFEEANANL